MALVAAGLATRAEDEVGGPISVDNDAANEPGSERLLFYGFALEDEWPSPPPPPSPPPHPYAPPESWDLEAILRSSVPTSGDPKWASSLSIHAGVVMALVNRSSVELVPSRNGAHGATALHADPSGVSPSPVEDNPGAASMHTGVIVIGTPAYNSFSGGAQVWVARGVGSAKVWDGPTRIVSVDGRPGWAGASAATHGGDVIVLGAPKDGGGASTGSAGVHYGQTVMGVDGAAKALSGAAYVFVPASTLTVASTADDAVITPSLHWTQVARLKAPTPAARDSFGTAVAVHSGHGSGDGWILVSAPAAYAGAGAVHVFLRHQFINGARGGWVHWQELRASDVARAPLGYGAGLAITGRILLIVCKPAAGTAGAGNTSGWGEVFVLARNITTATATATATAGSARVHATQTGIGRSGGGGGVVTTSVSPAADADDANAAQSAAVWSPSTAAHWLLDAVLEPPDVPGWEPEETTSGACDVGGETAVMSAVGGTSGAHR